MRSFEKLKLTVKQRYQICQKLVENAKIERRNIWCFTFDAQDAIDQEIVTASLVSGDDQEDGKSQFQEVDDQFGVPQCPLSMSFDGPSIL